MCITIERSPEVESKLNEVVAIIEKYGCNQRHLIPILQEIQRIYNYLPEASMYVVAELLSMPIAQIYGVATFYSGFALEPKGKYIIKVCNGTACHVKGSMNIIDEIRAKLSLNGENLTTEDMLFSLEILSCVGACGLAPVLMVNEDVHGQVKPRNIIKEIDRIIKMEKINEN